MKPSPLVIIFFLVIIFLVLMMASKAGYTGLFSGNETTPVPDSVLFTAAPVLTPEQALHTFRVAEGFRVEVVASEPLVQAPVAMDFDARGRLWVVEMKSYMPGAEGKGEDEKINRIVILDDRDHDGRMDHAKVFLDSLVLPRAISIVNGGILYAEPPNLWYVENINDTPGNRILIDTAYAVGGNPEHQPNGLMRGIDNWFYSAKSESRYTYEEGEWIKGHTEFRGQWGITKDNYGRLFYNTNSNQLRGDLVPPNRLNRNPDFQASLGINVEIAEDQRVYPARPTTGINRGYKEEMLDEAGRLTHFTAACGPVIYRGDQFPESYQGNAFVCEPAGNLVKRNILSEDGPYIEARQAYEGHEFLASTDERFRPVNAINGPDGSLYILDMYRGVIQHKTYLTDYLAQQIENRSLETPLGMGRIYRIVYEGNWYDRLTRTFHTEKPALDKASSATLVDYLSHPNGWWRDNAQRLLVERNDNAIVPEIIAVLRQNDPVGKIHALWTLEGMQRITPEIIQLGVSSGEPRVIATALRVGEQGSEKENANKIIDVYQNAIRYKDPVVQLQLALSLGEFLATDSLAVMRMLRTLAINNGDDALIRSAILSSLQDKEASFLAVLMEAPPYNQAMIRSLQEVMERSVVKDQLKSKQLTMPEQQQFIQGKSLFERTCAGCHNINGEGLVPIAPPLSGSEWVTGPEERLISIVLHGMKGPVTVRGKIYETPEVQAIMPGLKDNEEFTDEKLAAVLTYIRNAWENEAAAVTSPSVKAVREQHSERESPFTQKDFMP